MSKRNNQPSMTQIRKTLMGCVFDPRVPGPMKMICESGGRDYRLHRAIEFIKTAIPNQAKLIGASCGKTEITNAIALLALVLTEEEINENSSNLQSQERPRATDSRSDNQVSGR